MENIWIVPRLANPAQLDTRVQTVTGIPYNQLILDITLLKELAHNSFALEGTNAMTSMVRLHVVLAISLRKDN